MDNGWFALGGVVVGFLGNVFLEWYKGRILVRMEDVKAVRKAKTEGLPQLLNFCDRIMRGYDPTDKPDYKWLHSFCGEAEALRAHYPGFSPEVIDAFERVYVFLSLAKDVGHPDYDTADVEEFFENDFADEIDKLRKQALVKITAKKP